MQVSSGARNVFPQALSSARSSSMATNVEADTDVAIDADAQAAAPFRYRVLADQLAQELRDGRFPPGARLPSVRELCETHAASLSTVTHALHRLEDAGLIEARARSGFFSRVSPPDAAPSTDPVAPEALDARRERLMALAAAREGQLSLGHLGLPDDLLPLAALRRWTRHHLRESADSMASGTVAGSRRLRAAFAERLQRRGCEVTEPDLVLTAGEGESLRLCLDALTTPGDAVAVTTPVPLRLLELLQSRGLKVLELRAPKGATVVAELETMIAQHGVVLCLADLATSSMAGVRWDAQDCRSLVAVCTRHALPLVECDLLGELSISAEPPPSLKSFDEADRVLHCGSTACVTGVGWSAGWVASARHRVQLTAARAVHGELLPGLLDAVLADFLQSEDGNRHLRRLRRQLARRMGAWKTAVLAAFPAGTTVQHGPLGHQLWVTLPEGGSAQRLLAQARLAGISFVPGAVFTLGSDFDACLRITTAQPLDAHRQSALSTLGRLARSHGQA